MKNTKKENENSNPQRCDFYVAFLKSERERERISKESVIMNNSKMQQRAVTREQVNT